MGRYLDILLVALALAVGVTALASLWPGLGVQKASSANHDPR